MSQNIRLRRGTRGGGVKPLTSAATGTGVHHWWTYEEQPIPGIGKALVNVGTGNLLVSAMDVNVPEQGINLAFQRVYNSQSVHDVNGDDGGDPAIFGNGWTNNFDANIVYNGNVTPATITVYDLDGTACIYTADGNGGWTPCTGEYAKLAPVQNSQGCSYTWTKPNGTVYLFQSDGGNTGFCTGQYLAGHVREIISRNSNNYITLTYSWDSSGIKTSEHITQIVASHSDGDTLVMTFGLIAGTYNELSTITRPDSSVLQYWYDSTGNLVEVDKPGNDSAFSLPGNPHGQNQWQKGDLPETYAYNTGTSQMEEACGPRCTASIWANSNDGAALTFQYTSGNLTQWQVQGVLNFTPDDQTGVKLQPGSTQWQNWNTTTFLYGTSGLCGNPNNNVTYMCDQDGHATKWTTDSSARVTQTSRFAVNQWIVTTQVWDGANNLLSTTDANGNTTQYGYDASGNMVEMQAPNATDFTLNGSPNQSLNPVSLYSYDTNNNVVAYCDPVWTYTNHVAFNPNPTDTMCPSATGSTYFTYNYDQTNEPFGCLKHMYKPGGYHTKIKYDSGDDCSIGLPILVQGDAISQFNSSSRQPTQDFTYNQWGQLHTYDRGPDGSDNYDAWTLTYNQNGNHDNLNTERDENDSTISPNKMKSFTCYYPDGSVFYTETPQQHDADGNQLCPTTASLLQESGEPTPPAEATAHFYDYDGNEVRSVTYKGCSSNNSCSNTNTNITRCSSSASAKPIGTTCKYYDGLDRLVETAQPYDTRSLSSGKQYEFYAFRWMNRYIYDLSLSGSQGTLSISDQTGSTHNFAAYGNLYKTEEYLYQLNNNMHGCLDTTNHCTAPSGGQYSSASWSDVRGTSFDSLDRTVSKYELAFGHSAVTTNSYDGSGQLALLGAVVNAVNQTITYSYDGINRVQNVTFSSGDGDNRSYQYDADGRTASVKGTSFGKISYTYDLDGNELTVTEPTSGSGYNAGSWICYEYYPDGLREYLTIDDAANSHSQCSDVQSNGNPSNGGIIQKRIFSYAYTPDSRLAEQDVNWDSNPTEQFLWTYKPSGRQTQETDPLSGQYAIEPDGTTHRSIVSKQYTYGSYGRVNGVTLPGGYSESTLVYDQDDELAGYSSGPNVVRTMLLNSRGEMVKDSSTGDYNQIGAAQSGTQSANGTQVGYGSSAAGQTIKQIPPTTLEYDARSNMTICSTDPNFASDYSGAGLVYPYVYQYDAAGRQTQSGYDKSGNGATGDTTCDPSQANLATSTYDAENHIQSSNIYNALGTATWGPDGRQRISKVQDQFGNKWTETAHWDGDSILFATGGSSDPQLYIGKLAVMSHGGDLDIFDRDQTGAAVSHHGYATASHKLGYMSNGNWIDSWTSGSVRSVTSYKGGKQYYFQFFVGTCDKYYTDQFNNTTWEQCPSFAPPLYPSGATFDMGRADGYAMVGGIVQGARSYDSVSGQWLTPDAYAGDVNDPMSQKPFVWNGNNPMQWSDPSGYDPTIIYSSDTSKGQQGQVDSTLKAIEEKAASLPDTPQNAIAKALGEFLTSPASSSVTITVSDETNDLQYNASGAVTGGKIVQFDFSDPSNLTLYMGSVNAIAAAQGSKKGSEALAQGLSNDIGMSGLLQGTMGTCPEQVMARDAMANDMFTNDEKNLDDVANQWILGPLGLPPDQ